MGKSVLPTSTKGRDNITTCLRCERVLWRTKNMLPIVIFLLSIVLQLLAAIYALLLIRITGRKSAWILISIAMVLMTSRRIVSFISIISAGREVRFDIPEVIALIISILMLLGVLRIRNYFQSIKLAEAGRRDAEEALKKSENRYRTIAEASNDIIFVINREDKVEYLNAFGAGLFGLKPEEIIGRQRETLFPKDISDDQKVKLIDVFKTGLPLYTETKTTFPKGELWIGTLLVPVYDVSGTVVSVMGISRDITERKNAAKEQRLLAEVMSASLNEIYIFSAQSLHFKFINDGALRNLGYTLEQAQALTPLDLKPEYTQESFHRLIIGPLLRHEKQVQHFETVHRRSDGSLYPIEVFLQLFEIEGEQVFCAIINDITERKKAEKVLLESENNFRKLSDEFQSLLDAISDNLTMQTPDLKILWANRAAAAGLGMEVSDLVGQYCYKLWHKHSTPCKPCPVQRTFISGNVENDVVTTPDGRIWDLRTFPIKDERGMVINVIEIGRDITEHRKLEAQFRQAQKMEAVGTLTGGIAHDFNNILTAIIGYAGLLQMKMKEDDPLRHNVEQVLASAERAANLTQGLLAFSRKQMSNPQPVNLNDLIKKVERLLLRVIGEHIEFKTRLTDRDLTVMADAVQIEQVLINFAANARDAMPHGGTLTVETEVVEIDEEYKKAHGFGDTGLYVRISIEDTGFGMDKETKERIFEPFFTTKEVGKGTGLGLSVVYGIIKQHNGYINCYSEPGKGTTFRIYLPLIEAVIAEEREIKETQKLEGGTETILVAEDEVPVRKLTMQVLEGVGYKVIEAVDGEDTVRKFMDNKDSIQLLLVDVVMPKMNGREAYKKIKETKPDIKALFVSGYPADFIHRERLIEEGLDFIAKPIAPTALLRKIREVLDKK